MSNATIIGFLEEEPGVKSMCRLTTAQMVLAILAIVVAIIVVALKGGENAAGIIAALGGVIGVLAGGVWAALKVRNSPALPAVPSPESAP